MMLDLFFALSLWWRVAILGVLGCCAGFIGGLLIEGLGAWVDRQMVATLQNESPISSPITTEVRVSIPLPISEQSLRTVDFAAEGRHALGRRLPTQPAAPKGTYGD